MLELVANSVGRLRSPSRIWLAWWAVLSRFLIHGLVFSTWVSRIPTIQTTLGLSNASLGLCLLGTAVGSVVAAPSTGWLIARFGSKKVTTWSTVGFSLALVGPSLASSPAALFLALGFFGAMAGANDVAINSQGVAVEEELGSPTMSRFHAMFSIGGMAGAALGALLAAHEVNLQVHLAGAAAILLLFSAATGWALFETRARQTDEEATPIRGKRIPPVLIGLVVIGFSMFLCEGAIADWSAVYLKQVLGAGPGQASAAYAAFSVGMGLFRLLGDKLTARMGPVSTLRRGALVGAAALVLALLMPTPQLALPCFALVGAGFAVTIPIAFGAGGRVKSIPSGTGVAMVSASGYIGFLFGPPLIGLISQWSSLRFALLLVVALSLVAATLAGSVRWTERQEA